MVCLMQSQRTSNSTSTGWWKNSSHIFPGSKIYETNENKLIGDPFCMEVDDVPEAWQEEFLDLKNYSAARDAF